MSRLIIPDDFPGQLSLLANIVAENNSLAADNPLTAFLTQHNIVLDDDVIAANAAQTHETNRTSLSRQSENFCQLRNNGFKQSWSHLTGSVQFLKSFYKDNTKELGNWGITVTDGGRIDYPANFADKVVIFNEFVEKNNSFAPGTSLLQPFLTQHNIDLETDAAEVKQAVQNDASFTAAAQQSENETELRNKIWAPVLAHIRDIGNFLMKLYANNPKALSAWGFQVDHSPQQPHLRTSKIKPGETVSISGLVIGGTLTNTGSIEIHLFRGRTAMGDFTVLKPAEQYGILKGYSIITIANPSTVDEAKITALTKH